MSPQAQAVLTRLESTWNRWWICSLLTGIVLAVAASLALLLAGITADALLQLSPSSLTVLAILWCLASIWIYGRLILRLVRFHRGLPALARRLELECPEIGSHLINLVQLLPEPDAPPHPFRTAAIEQAAHALQEVPFEHAAERETRRRRFALCMQTPHDLAEASAILLAILTLGTILFAISPRWAAASQRLTHPWTFIPAVGSITIEEITPGHTEILIGSPLTVSARIANPLKRPLQAALYTLPEAGSAPRRESAIRMFPSADFQTFSATIPRVDAPLRYRLQIADTQSPRFHVGVYQKPAVTAVSVLYQYPDYLALPPRSLEQPHADLEAPQFTRATLQIHASTPLSDGHLLIDGQKRLGIVQADGKTLQVDLVLDQTSAFTIHLVSSAGHTDPSPRVNTITVQPDLPPLITLVEPRADARATRGGKLPIVLRAADDHGLGEVLIERRLPPQPDAAPPAASIIKTWPNPQGSGEILLSHSFVIAAEDLKNAPAFEIRGVARDRARVALDSRKLEPQESATPWVRVRLADPESQSADQLARLDDVRSALFAVLQRQVEVRVATGRLGDAEAPPPDALHAQTTRIRSEQAAIQQRTSEITSQVEPGDDESLRAIVRAARKLARDELPAATRLADALASTSDPSDRKPAAASLAALQDQIIDILRRILNELRQNLAEQLAELDRKPETAIPADVADKLRALDAKLQEFLKQQKKIIESTQQLAKKGVDDFTSEDDKSLAELAAAEDEWARFMAESHSDFSKLPDQDFSNPSLLEEMIAVETQLKMARDALAKKSIEIAVPLEQLGAEMAKEMTTNIEKWLPDTPDRERWSQEEPLTDDMKQAPMAELPRELEDLVGDLMEDEEDLFDEMEDVSSSWADSIDKGAGWDAMDGPISNMSARGVTGNRLPNNSEIGGRSGEGRSGKSSGEFVGDSAVGKGGRRTPTRLAPDPYVAGQVKDTSKDPVGGATGGGKQSGAGGEGLQGPVPERPAQTMQRLAQKQAEIRNKAEALDPRFQILQYHKASFDALLEQMTTIEQDLRAGRYQSALRRRDVLLQGLDQVRSALAGEYQIRQDRSSNLPTEIQKQILGSMTDPSPLGWEALNRRYFDRLGASPRTGQSMTPAPASGGPPPSGESGNSPSQP
jgi:hypothetical protein